MIFKSLKNNRLFLDFFNYFSGRLLTKGIAFLSIPIFSRLLLPEEFGVVALFFSLFLVGSILIELNFSGSIRQYILKDNQDAGSYLFSTLSFILLLFIAIVGPLLFFFSDHFCRYFEIDKNIYLLLIITSFSNIFIHYYEFYLLGVNHSKTYSIFSFIRALFEISISVFFIVLIFTRNDLGRISGIAISYLLFGIYSFVRLIILVKGNFRIKSKHIRYALLFSVPLIIHQLSHIILAQVDRVIIKKLLDYSQVGLYSMAYSIGMVMQIVVISFNSAWLPKFYKHMQNEEYGLIKKELVSNLGLLTLLSIAASAGLSLLIPLIISSNYSDSFSIIHIIIMSSVLNFIYLMYANFSFYQHKTWYISLGSVIAAGTNIALNLILIPRFGYKVAALTTVISYLAMAVLHYFIARIILRSPVVPIFKVLKFLVPYALWILAYTYIITLSHTWRIVFEFSSIGVVLLIFIKVYTRKWAK